MESIAKSKFDLINICFEHNFITWKDLLGKTLYGNKYKMI